MEMLKLAAFGTVVAAGGLLCSLASERERAEYTLQCQLILPFLNCC